MDKNIKLPICIVSLTTIALLFFLLGYMVAYFSQSRETIDKEAIIQQTKNQIKSRFIEEGVIPPVPKEVHALIDGNIKKIGENYLIVTPSLKQDPFGDIFPKTVKILIDENTQIKKWELKSIDVFKKEMQEYQESPNKTNENPPNQYVLRESQLSDMKPGNYILIAESESNIKGIKEFLARRVEFSEQILHVYNLNR